MTTRYKVPARTTDPAQIKARNAYELFMLFGATPAECQAEYERVLVLVKEKSAAAKKIELETA
jgi:hypothetical protein